MATQSTKHRLFCSLPKMPERTFSDDVSPRRELFIRSIEKTWVNGTRLKYCFLDHTRGHGTPEWWTGSQEDKNVVKRAFDIWKEVGIGLDFEEVDTPADAHIRIGFEPGGGSWSYLGRDILTIPKNRRTMNFGWPLSQDQYGEDTAVHEIGHTLAAPHEHQNPNAGIDWNEAAVYRYFSGPPNNWDRQTIYHNILRMVPQREVDGSSWDPDSIMHYDFDAQLIDGPGPYNEAGINPEPGLSEADRNWVSKFYPPLAQNDYIRLEPYRSHRASLRPGDQMNFIIEPEVTRKHTVQTFGKVDTLLVLFEKKGNDEIYLAGDDDSGLGFNAKIRYRLIKGRTYVLRLRFYYSLEEGNTAVMVW